MLNIFSLICICLNSTLYSNSFFVAKLPEAYAFLNPMIITLQPGYSIPHLRKKRT
ncbi:hypothetical protein UlMin_018155 [Ulmus minor]